MRLNEHLTNLKKGDITKSNDGITVTVTGREETNTKNWYVIKGKDKKGRIWSSDFFKLFCNKCKR